MGKQILNFQSESDFYQFEKKILNSSINNLELQLFLKNGKSIFGVVENCTENLISLNNTDIVFRGITDIIIRDSQGARHNISTENIVIIDYKSNSNKSLNSKKPRKKKLKQKIIIKALIFSFFWIILPLGTVGTIFSFSQRQELKSKLTPYSVSVRGYYRKDGTYVRPHKRRPPGSVAKDSPVKNELALYGLLMFVSIGSMIGSTWYLVYKIKNSEANALSIIKNYEHQKSINIKNEIEEQNIRCFKIICNKTDISHLSIDKPHNLGNFYYFGTKNSHYICQNCKCHFSRTSFFIYFIPKVKQVNYCIECARRKFPNDYNKEFLFITNYENIKNKFYGDFEMNRKKYCPEMEFEKNRIDDYFHFEILKKLSV